MAGVLLAAQRRPWDWVRRKAFDVNNFGKNLALWIIIGLLLVALFNLFQSSSTRSPQTTVPFSELLAEVNRGQVADVTIKGSQVSGHFTDGRSFSTYMPSDAGLVSKLEPIRPKRSIRLEAIALAGLVFAALLTEPFWTLTAICLVYLALMPLGIANYAKVKRQRAAANEPDGPVPSEPLDGSAVP